MDNASPSYTFIPLPKGAKDITGQRFGRLVALGPIGRGNQAVKWLCQCDCGVQKVVPADHLKRKSTSSCGCLLRERYASPLTHGKARTRIYRIWQGVKSRCLIPGKKYYSERGIGMYPEWADSFEAFDAYVSQLPHYDEKGYTLDRIDNNGNYEPGNLRWATASEQCWNSSRTHWVTFQGRTQCVRAWCQELNMPHTTFYGRLRLGWSVEAALSVPVKQKKASKKGEATSNAMATGGPQ